MSHYQIYCDRGHGLELDGCWGSENAQFSNRKAARVAAKFLSGIYTDCDWVVCDMCGKREFYRVAASKSAGWRDSI